MEKALAVDKEREIWGEERPTSDLQPIPPDLPTLCDICPKKRSNSATSHCEWCEQDFCEKCWWSREEHQAGDPEHKRVVKGNIAAEDPGVVFNRLEQVFYGQANNTSEKNKHGVGDAQNQQHDNVLKTLWLAVTEHSGDTKLSFTEYLRFEQAMEEHRIIVQDELKNTRTTSFYPRLISFIGITGAGKSSVVEVLTRHSWDPKIPNDSTQEILVPVTGNSNSHKPTSSDIHLYHDPIEARVNQECPLFYVDSEGFEGGGHSEAAQSKGKSMSQSTIKFFASAKTQMTRGLDWLQGSGRRTTAIETLYPRLIYNISDVIVYVVAQVNIKTLRSILEKLVEWSRTARTSSINKTSRPSLIILINQCDPKTVSVWGSKETTSEMLKDLEDMFDSNQTFQARKEELRRQDMLHESIKDILKGSYPEIKFLRLPNARDKLRLKQQFEELHNLIISLSEKVHTRRKENGALLSSDFLPKLYRHTFDHFSKSTTTPFDFLSAFLAVNPLPPGLAGNFLGILQASADAINRKNSRITHEKFAQRLPPSVVPLLCSTIAVYLQERQFPGSVSVVLRGIGSKLQSNRERAEDDSNEEILGPALQDFVDSTVRCGYTVEATDEEDMRRCANVKKAHSHRRGQSQHQDLNGHSLGQGSFDSSIEEIFWSHWNLALEIALKELEFVDQSNLWKHHREAIRTWHGWHAGATLHRLPSCVWCMHRFPSERLPCNHWICSPCLVRNGKVCDNDSRVFKVSRCDQHPTGSMEFDQPFEFLNLPHTIGRRILSLDEGGVRGIFQLKLLAAIQDRLGKHIHLQDCFDLIGGTGIGGVHALVMGICGWDIAKAKRRFERWVPEAFVDNLSVWDHIFIWRKKPAYARTGLIQSIDRYFGDHNEDSMAESLSVATGAGRGEPSRVFVTSNKMGQGGMLLANYHRQSLDANQKQGPRDTQKRRKSLKCVETCTVGDAAKATASFEPFFGPCIVSSDYGLHTGGAKNFACPAQVALDEAQALWPNLSNCSPDVLVSVGCGHEPSTGQSSNNCTDSDSTWNEVFGEKSRNEPSSYIRICPEFLAARRRDFKSDNVSLLKNTALLNELETILGGDTSLMFRQNGLDDKVARTARRLISTSFYFAITSNKPSENDRRISGHIRCRFRETSEMTKAIGRTISSMMNPRFDHDSKTQWSFDGNALETMISQGKFRAPSATELDLTITLRHQQERVEIQFVADGIQPETVSGSLYEHVRD